VRVTPHLPCRRAARLSASGRILRGWSQTCGSLSPGLFVQLRCTPGEAINNGWNQWVKLCK
jgi:hypothetical protein